MQRLKLMSQLWGCVMFGMDFVLWWTSHLQGKMSPFVSTAWTTTLASYPSKLFLAPILERFYWRKVANSIALVVSSLMRLSAKVTGIMWKPCSKARLLNHLMFHKQQLSTKRQLFSIMANLCYGLASHLRDIPLGISMGDSSYRNSDTVTFSCLIR